MTKAVPSIEPRARESIRSMPECHPPLGNQAHAYRLQRERDAARRLFLRYQVSPLVLRGIPSGSQWKLLLRNLECQA